jgi:hypothetical protein|uniref:hypothetical protein n=1 Tax=Phocaeicola vulgatus TaxID=821 RepID=UPI003FF01781
MTDKKHQIHEFSPTIYPFRLWVSVNPSFEDVKDKFWLLNKKNERIDFDAEESWNSTTTVASCYPVSDKESGWIGIFCGIFRKDRLSVGTTAHEASHITDFISDSFGLSGFNFDDGEARAYLIEWAANCIWNVKSGKFKDLKEE